MKHTFNSLKRWELASLAMLAILGIILGSLSCSRGTDSGKVESISIGMDGSAVNSLIFIAQDQNYFSANGINLQLKEYASGAVAVDDLLKVAVDVATAAEFVIVTKALAGEKIQTLASIDKFQHNYIFGRKDRGITTVADLKCKKIGVPLKTISEFYLGRFLELQGISTKQVTLVNINPLQSADVLANGEVDALIAWEPNAKAIEHRLGDGVVKWPAQSQQAGYANVIATPNWISGHPDLAIRFLKSLNQAEEYLINHPAEARSIIQKRLQYDNAFMAVIWAEHQFSLSLDQSLIIAMEDEARWEISNNLTNERTLPDFMNSMYPDSLKAIKPGAVNISK
jgi:ABC-type nitrate/sulfonate/bicarbonate transport system substrate-binding protein